MSASTVDATEDRTAPRFKHVICWMCNGTGIFSWSWQDNEQQEPCRACNGKRTVVVEAAQ